MLGCINSLMRIRLDYDSIILHRCFIRQFSLIIPVSDSIYETDITKLEQGHLATFNCSKQFKLGLQDYKMVFLRL